MFDWLYSKAKQLKKYVFSLSGAGVAVSLATTRLYPMVSWIANLVAVTGGWIYSITKNAETAQATTERQSKILELTDQLRLSKYQAEPSSLLDVLSQVTNYSHEEIEVLIKDISENLASESEKYALSNGALQTLLGIATIIVNALANLESEQKDNPWTTKAILILT